MRQNDAVDETTAATPPAWLKSAKYNPFNESHQQTQVSLTYLV